MDPLTERQIAALANGEARLYNGRVIPIIRGGSDLEPEGDPPAEPVAEAPEEPVADEPADDPAPEPDLPPAAQIDWNSPEVQAQLDQRVQYGVQQALQAQQPAPEPQPAFDWSTYDPYDPDSVREGFRDLIREEIGPMRQVAETMQEREVRAQADTTMDSLGVSEDDRAVVMQFATGAAVAAQNAGQDIGLEQAIRHGASILQERDKRITEAAGQAAVEQYKADLAAKATGGTREPSAPSTAGLGVEPAAGNLVDAAKAFAERQRLAG